MNTVRTWLWIAVVIAGTAQAADPVYRCGADGRSYSSTPCAGGRSVDVADPRNAAEQSAGRDAARREAELAASLRRERHQREAAAILPVPRGQARPAATLRPQALPELEVKKSRGVSPAPKKGARERVSPKPKRSAPKPQRPLRP
jgi:hypothetical protein